MLQTDGPHIDLAQTGGDRAHFGRYAIGQVLGHACQALADLLAGEKDIRLIGEDRRHLRETIAAKRTAIFEARNAGERSLDRERHLLFDQFGRKRGRTDVDLHLIVGDVRHCVDRQARQGGGADHGGNGGQQQDEPALVNRPCYDWGDHRLSPPRLRSCRVRP